MKQAQISYLNALSHESGEALKTQHAQLSHQQKQKASVQVIAPSQVQPLPLLKQLIQPCCFQDTASLIQS